jgi:SAM-dependent methyltransferase
VTVDHNARQRAYFEERVPLTMVPSSTPYVRRHVDELVRFAGVGPADAVLEVGCGMGRYTFELAAKGLALEALDLSPVLLERLRAYQGDGDRIPLHCGDVADPPATLAGRFDAVVGFFMLHHLDDLGACFAGMATLLKPGGRIAFLEPNAFNPLYYLQVTLTPGMRWRGDKGLVHMRPSVLFPAMAAAGLTDLAQSRFGFFPPVLANRPWGARLERLLERPQVLHPVLPFQLVRGVRP